MPVAEGSHFEYEVDSDHQPNPDPECARCLELVHNLQAALESRHAIALAVGVLMQRFDVDETAAFRILVRWSQQSNVKVRVIAVATVRHRHSLDHRVPDLET